MKIKDFTWVLYPVIVGLFIVISSQYLFDVNRWQALSEDREKVKIQEDQISNLRKKLSILTSVDSAVEEANLKFLVSAVPNSKMVWYLVSELKLAASDSGAILDEYEGEVGTNISESNNTETASPAAVIIDNTSQDLVLSTKMRFKDLGALKNFFSSLYNRMPLLSVEQVEYSGGETKLVVKGAWSPSKSAVGDASDLPEYKPSVEAAKKLLEGFVGFGEVVVASNEGGVVTNPF